MHKNTEQTSQIFPLPTELQAFKKKKKQQKTQQQQKSGFIPTCKWLEHLPGGSGGILISSGDMFRTLSEKEAVESKLVMSYGNTEWNLSHASH